MIPGMSGFPADNTKHELKENTLFPGYSPENQHLIKSAPVCSWYLNLFSCLVQHSVCQTSNQGIRDNFNVKITMTSSGSTFLLGGASKEVRHRLHVLSLMLFEQNEHFANGGQLLCKYLVIAPVKSKTL